MDQEMLKLYFSPHMESTDNAAGRASGFADVPLTPYGEDKSRELGGFYADYPLDVVFCSDLKRAVDTAHIAFASRALPIIADARLRETNYGDMTQMPTSDLDAVFTRHIRTPFPNGESLAMAVERTGNLLREALRDHSGRTILIIGHRATKTALEYYFGTLTLEEIVAIPWEWRDVPIWEYSLDHLNLDRPDDLGAPPLSD
jgi:alpha-ribazole phosphatase/probable phosphoglycerate mutase